MKKIALIGVLIAIGLSPQGWTAEYFVAPAGNDANPGTEAKPFATLERARDATRSARGSTVTLGAGTYRLTNTFALDERDSGTTYRAIAGSAWISGGVAVAADAVKPVTDPAMLERLLPEVRGKVKEVDLRALGIKDFGELGPRGFRRPYIPAPLEMFVNGQPLNIAQWPNPGEPGVPIGKVLDRGSNTRRGEKPTRGGIFMFNSDRPDRWTQARDVWITGLFENGYADNTVQVKAIDLEKKTITTVQPHMYGFSSGAPWNRWTALNLIEEIDLPGEYATDKEAGKLYFLPPKDTVIGRSTFEVSMMKEPLVAIEGAKGVVFDGVNFENSRGMGVYIERGADNRIENATLRNFGLVAVCIGKGVAPDPDYQAMFTGQPIARALGSWHEHIYNNPAYNRDAGTGQSIRNCKIYNIGEGAISLGGGDRMTLTPAGNCVENCEIHDFNRWDRTMRTAVNIDGVGNRIAHCLIYNAPGGGIYIHGNDHVIEYNEVHHVMMNGDDMGALYMGRDPTERGTVIRYNYWHDLAPRNSTYCVYLDDSGCDGTKVYGNVFRRAGNDSTILTCGGSDFEIENNLFVDCGRPLLQTSYRGGSTGAFKLFNLFKQRMELVNYNKSPWAEHYPGIADYFAGPHPRNNKFERNLVIKGNDPRLVDPARGNYGIKPGADTGIEGFTPIPFDEMGLIKNP